MTPKIDWILPGHHFLEPSSCCSDSYQALVWFTEHGCSCVFPVDCFYLDRYTADVSSIVNKTATNLAKSISLLIFKSTCATQVGISVLRFQMAAARPQAYVLCGHNVLHLPQMKRVQKLSTRKCFHKAVNHQFSRETTRNDTQMPSTAGEHVVDIWG